jgi:hypothetical protein
MIKKQQEYIDEKVKERDQKLMESIRQVQEVKEQLTVEKENKGFFSWIFKKKINFKRIPFLNREKGFFFFN